MPYSLENSVLPCDGRFVPTRKPSTPSVSAPGTPDLEIGAGRLNCKIAWFCIRAHPFGRTYRRSSHIMHTGGLSLRHACFSSAVRRLLCDKQASSIFVVAPVAACHAALCWVQTVSRSAGKAARVCHTRSAPPLSCPIPRAGVPARRHPETYPNGVSPWPHIYPSSMALPDFHSSSARPDTAARRQDIRTPCANRLAQIQARRTSCRTAAR